ncbi:lysophospholipase [Solirubrobacter taibaiensis]|nr:lysophospholipase [Solirubrobacter taibaiensis]
MTSTTLPSRVLSWDEPTGINPRGTLIVLTGRGESPAVYERFGRRLANDAYRVRVIETRLDDLVATRAEVEAQLDGAVAPHVLVGSDAGAAFAAQLAHALDADALVLAGLTVAALTGDELEARTACPAHRARLAETSALGHLADEVPEALRDVRPPAVPTLVIHGAADPVSPPPQLPGAETVTIAGGRHDILNDVTHRTVAATIVLFLERLRHGADIVV